MYTVSCIFTNCHCQLFPHHSVCSEVFMDGSSIASKPTELCYLWSPNILRGCYAPPCVGNLKFSNMWSLRSQVQQWKIDYISTVLKNGKFCRGVDYVQVTYLNVWSSVTLHAKDSHVRPAEAFESSYHHRPFMRFNFYKSILNWTANKWNYEAIEAAIDHFW